YPVTIYQFKAMLRTPNGLLAETADDVVIQALNDKEDVQDAFFELLERIKGRIKRRKKSKNKGVWDDEE
ncbi:hypothetical protein WG681_004891, partial [Salmonella enterica subsp. enterica serovar Newport]